MAASLSRIAIVSICTWTWASANSVGRTSSRTSWATNSQDNGPTGDWSQFALDVLAQLFTRYHPFKRNEIDRTLWKPRCIRSRRPLQHY